MTHAEFNQLCAEFHISATQKQRSAAYGVINQMVEALKGKSPDKSLVIEMKDMLIEIRTILEASDILKEKES